ncbi:DNA ligase [bacterium (Candidatus Torokbacteria) CG_4_10_14_0_2_um_filter_35_8]|nr:MAG: DNA ligase [bacterium (Candidatus Torokbacteria) CG_4_10_14_0_2_um_filter_35_8]
MSPKNSLEKYHKKRDFKRTIEPEGGKKKRSKKPIFIVQKHKARNLHYDFRLEIGGVLKSWAVPKGPSLDPKVKRLAILVEDHPLEYADFEGKIPEGEYGAGSVIIWDKGTYKNVREEDGKKISMEKSFKDGYIEIELKGKKLKGSFSLIRTKIGWLLVKHKT